MCNSLPQKATIKWWCHIWYRLRVVQRVQRRKK